MCSAGRNLGALPQGIIKRLSRATKEEVLGLSKWELRELCRSGRTLTKLGGYSGLGDEAKSAQAHLLAVIFSAANSAHGATLRQTIVACSSDIRPYMSREQHEILNKMAQLATSEASLATPSSQSSRQWMLLAAACGSIYGDTDKASAAAAVERAAEAISHVVVTEANKTQVRIAMLHIFTGLNSVNSLKVSAKACALLQQKGLELLGVVLSSLAREESDVTTDMSSMQTAVTSVFLGINVAVTLPLVGQHDGSASAHTISTVQKILEALASKLSPALFLESMMINIRKLDHVLRFISMKILPHFAAEAALILADTVFTATGVDRSPLDVSGFTLGGYLRLVSFVDAPQNQTVWSPDAISAKNSIAAQLLNRVYFPLPETALHATGAPHVTLSTTENPQELIFVVARHGNDKQYGAMLEFLCHPDCGWTQCLFSTETSHGRKDADELGNKLTPVAMAHQVMRWKMLLARMRSSDSKNAGLSLTRADEVYQAVVESLVCSLRRAVERCSPDARVQDPERSLTRSSFFLVVEPIEALMRIIVREASHTSKSTSKELQRLLQPSLVLNLLRNTSPNTYVGIMLMQLVGTSLDQQSDLRRELMSMIATECTPATSGSFHAREGPGHAAVGNRVVEHRALFDALSRLCATSGFQPHMVAMYEVPLQNCLTHLRQQRNMRSTKLPITRSDVNRMIHDANEAYSILSKSFRTKHAKICGEQLCNIIEVILALVAAHPSLQPNSLELVRSTSRKLLLFANIVICAPPPRSNQTRLHDSIASCLRIALHVGETLQGSTSDCKAHHQAQALTWASLSSLVGRRAQQLMEQTKKGESGRGAGAAANNYSRHIWGGSITDPSKATRFLTMYHGILMTAVAAARRIADEPQMPLPHGLNFHEVICLYVVDAALHISLEHQRAIRLLSSTNVLSKKPPMRCISLEMLDLYVTALEKTVDSFEAQTATRGPTSTEALSGDAGVVIEGSQRSLLILKDSRFLVDSLVVSFELAPHAGFSVEQRERLLALLQRVLQWGDIRSRHRKALFEVIAKGEVLFC